MSRVKAAERVRQEELWSMAHPGWEKHYVILEGEVPWWEIGGLTERKRVCGRQQRRMWRVRCQSHARAYNLKAMLKWGQTQVYTLKTPTGKPGCMPAPYKRKHSEVCELCDRSLKRLGWHHWIISNPSVGIWSCNLCNQFAEAVDSSWPMLGKRYIFLKAILDEQFADGNRVRLAKEANIRHQLSVTVEGVHKTSYDAWGKRDRPTDNMCEICGAINCKDYHHWDNDALGKGLWLCRICHAFAERFDTYGKAFIEKYLSLKRQDELRVFSLMKANGIEITSNMFSCGSIALG